MPSVESLPIATVPFEDAWGLALGAFGVAALLFLLWSQSGSRPLLFGSMAGLAVAVVTLAADRIVVTDREAVAGLFDRLAAAAQAGDTATILDAFDTDSQQIRTEADRTLERFRPDEVKVTRVDVTIDGRGPGRRARAELLVHARGTLRGDVAGPGTLLLDVDVGLRENAGRWLITDFDFPDRRLPGR